MIVEFFGVPGAGKTTLLKRISQRLPHAEEARVGHQMEIVRYALWFALRYPRAAFYWMQMLYKNQHGLFRYKLSLLLRSLAALMKARSRDERGKIVFIDEGMLQRSLSLFERAVTEEEREKIFRYSMPSHFIIIFPEGNFSRFTKEIDATGSPRFKQGASAFKKWTDAVLYNVAHIAKYIEQNRAHATYIRNDAEERQLDEKLLRAMKEVEIAAR